MDSIRHLITFFLKVAFAFFLFAFVWWVVSIFFPFLSIHSFISSTTGSSTPQEDWLPSPRKYSSLFNKKKVAQNEYTNVYVAPAPYNGYTLNNKEYTYTSYNYVTYTSTGTSITEGVKNSQGENRVSATGPITVNDERISSAVPTSSPVALLNERVLSVRNLSIYEGGHVYTGLSFIGEAKATMFRDGKFPIVVVNQKGQVIGVSAAIATTNWAVPGWVRFETKIVYPLPSNAPCTMIFEEALTQAERSARQPLRVPIQVRCN